MHYRKSGFNDADALYLAGRVTDPYGQCEVCGFPQRLLAHFEARRVPSPFAKQVWTLTADHIIPRSHGGPDVRENIRILCALCNTRRGDNVRTDEVVLRWVQMQWHRMFTNRNLWWLNKSPGQGGLAYIGKDHPRWVLHLKAGNSAFRAGYLTRRTLQGVV